MSQVGEDPQKWQGRKECVEVDDTRQIAWVIETKLQGKTQENPYFTLNYKEHLGFPGFFPEVCFYDLGRFGKS